MNYARIDRLYLKAIILGLIKIFKLLIETLTLTIPVAKMPTILTRKIEPSTFATQQNSSEIHDTGTL